MTQPEDPPLDFAHLTPEARRAHVVHLKHRGNSFDDIGQLMGFSKQRAHELYWEAMREVKPKAVGEIRESLNAQYDDIRNVVAKLMHASNNTPEGDKTVLDAARELRQVLADVAKLNGALAPVQVQVGGLVQFEVKGVDTSKLT